MAAHTGCGEYTVGTSLGELHPRIGRRATRFVTDVYTVFRRMLERGIVPDSIDGLLALSDKA